MPDNLQVGDQARIERSIIIATVAGVRLIGDVRVYQIKVDGELVMYEGFDNWYTRDQLKTKREEN